MLKGAFNNSKLLNSTVPKVKQIYLIINFNQIKNEFFGCVLILITTKYS